jgi:hypothetical protein
MMNIIATVSSLLLFATKEAHVSTPFLILTSNSCQFISKYIISFLLHQASKGALSTCLSRYPGYLGPLDVSGSKIIAAFDEGDTIRKFKYVLRGAESNCVNCGGVHIHSGTTCDDKDLVGGHYWDPAKTEDLWTAAGVYNTTFKGNAKGSFSLTNGFDLEANLGHAVVMHDSAGTRIGCGVLSYSRDAAKGCVKRPQPRVVLEACVTKYPGYTGSLDMKGKIKAKYGSASNSEVAMSFNLKEAAPNCETCGLHIHTGTTCDNADEVGGHYYDVVDPWTTEGGAIYSSDSNGVAKGKFKVNAGHNVTLNDGHAVVVHDAAGTRYGCGILSADKKLKGTCF